MGRVQRLSVYIARYSCAVRPVAFLKKRQKLPTSRKPVFAQTSLMDRRVVASNFFASSNRLA